MATRYEGSSTRGDSESVTLVGPSEPATIPLPVGLDRASGDLGAGLAELVHVILEPALALRDRMRREGVGRHEVGAGLEVGTVDRLDVVGPREAENVDVATQILRMTASEACAADVLLGQPERLHLRAHGAVEDDDPLGEQCCQSVCRAHGPPSTSPSTAGRPRLRAVPAEARGLFRRLVTRSPSCLKAVRVTAA